MTNQPFISIILVCYNYAHLLPRALEMIAKQQFHDFELIFVNNGCTDNTQEVLQQWMSRNPTIPVNIIYIKTNRGLAYGENKGVEAAVGKYLLFHDADDWMDDNTLQLLADAANENDADRVIAAFRDIDEDGNVMQIQELGDEPNYWLYSMQQGNLFRTELYKKNKIKTVTYSPDVEKSFLFSAVTNRAAYVHTPCYNYYVSSKSTSHQKNYYKRLFSKEYSFLTLLEIWEPVIPSKTNHNYAISVFQITSNVLLKSLCK